MSLSNLWYHISSRTLTFHHQCSWHCECYSIIMDCRHTNLHNDQNHLFQPLPISFTGLKPSISTCSLYFNFWLLNCILFPCGPMMQKMMIPDSLLPSNYLRGTLHPFQVLFCWQQSYVLVYDTTSLILIVWSYSSSQWLTLPRQVLSKW